MKNLRNSIPTWTLLIILLLGSYASAQTELWKWSSDRSKFAYQNRSVQSYQTWVCDLGKGRVSPAFDADQIKPLLKEKFQIEVTQPIRFLGFDRKNDNVIAVGQQAFVVRGPDRIEKAKGWQAANSGQRFFRNKKKSGNSSDRSQLSIQNKTKASMLVHWIDFAGRPIEYAKLEAGKSYSTSTFEGHVWRLKSSQESSVVYFQTRGREDVVVIDDQTFAKSIARKPEPNSAPATQRLRSPFQVSRHRPREREAFVRDHNLFFRKDQQEVMLTTDATPEFSFQRFGSGTRWFGLEEEPANRGHLFWSPNGKYLLAYQTKQVPEPRVRYIESHPKGQLQPKINSYQYPKPGDELPINRPRLFSWESGKEIPLDNKLFENPFSLRMIGWEPSGDRCWLRYNQRGHQVVRILEITAKTGKVRTLIEETCDTFVHYSDAGKSIFGSLGGDELLWASERNGWNHLYVYHRSTGKLLRQVTNGDWNVKRLHSVDYSARRIWFFAVGVYEDQDPYHEHLCSVNFDGSDFRTLTASDGTHQVSFLPGGYFLATWSRVDQAEVREIRSLQTGELVVELDRRDTAKAFGNRKLTTRFSAKGRDGKTDIWGVIHWPKDFDPNKKYPVIENIYAGPHDHHVPKRFQRGFGHRHVIADAGFIVVQIDGMGTAWRSKAFHDVCFQNLKDAGFPDRIAWMKAAAKAYPQMDVSRVGIYGGSAGGQNAMAALLWHHDFYSVAVADCGCHDNRMDKIWWNEQWMGWPVGQHYIDSSNMENAHLLQGHLMLTVGECDRNVDPASTTQVVAKLIEARKDFEFHLLPGKGHGAGESRWAAQQRLDFFKKHLLDTNLGTK